MIYDKMDIVDELKIGKSLKKGFFQFTKNMIMNSIFENFNFNTEYHDIQSKFLKFVYDLERAKVEEHC